MTWESFYLICFAVGFAFSFVAFLTGGLRWHFHIPHFPHGHVVHVPAPQGPAGTPSAAGAPKALVHTHVSPFNFVSFTAFLAWFGGIGYLLTRFSSMWFAMGLGIALLSGIGGASVIYLFLSRVLMSKEENLDPADFEMVGVLGKLCVPIREGGTGELIYSQAGTRRVCAARSEDGAAVAKGAEVVVTRYEKGIAYVRLWSELSGEES
jgi:hypothetical protein